MDESASPISSYILHGRAAGVARSARAWIICALVAVSMQAPLRAKADVAPAGADIGARSAVPDNAGAIRVPPPLPSDDVTTAMPKSAPKSAPTRTPKVTVYRAETPQNFEIDLRLLPVSEATESEVVLRLRGPNDYYVVSLDARAERVTFARVDWGETKEIASADCRIAVNAWHTVHIRAEDNRFKVSLDGAWLFTAYDSVLRSGRLAVWTRPGSRVRFGVIEVHPVGPE